MPLRGSHGKVLLAPSLSSFRLWSYSSRALPTACTNRRVSESRYPLPSPSRPLSEVYALAPFLSTKIMYVFCFSVKKVRLSGKNHVSSALFCLLRKAFPEKNHSFIRIASCFCHVFRLTLFPSFPMLVHVFLYGINGSIGG